ncbi:MAG: hypothetical protein EHM47_10595 [Ignavibacteriales bacterium]|nr:MAG: hypothetical protein EHM47_10595 [Ignavibacteriales bacterium]
MIKRHFHRRNLPHLYYNDGIYFVTYRLYGSIHQIEIEKYHRWIMKLKMNPLLQKRIFKKYDALLDRPANEIRFLQNNEIMEICKKSLHYYDEKLYKLICYCIMPNHIHLIFDLISEEKDIGQIMSSIKKFSGRRANKILGKQGPFWQAESFDRLVRDDIELYFIIKYVLLNPVIAGLVENWRDWKGTYCHPDYEVLD